MSRALRRHPAGGKTRKQRGGRPPAMVKPQPRKQQREARERRLGLKTLLFPSWASDIWSELRKVTWPSREDTWYLTFVVLIVASAFGVFLGGVDMFFNWAIDNTLLR